MLLCLALPVGFLQIIGMSEASDLYERDIVRWSERQAGLLRRVLDGDPLNEAPDWLNIIEEIEDLGISRRLELASCVGKILEHLIRLEASPADGPRRGWRVSVRTGRAELERLLKHVPSLRRTVVAVIADELPGAKARASAALADYGEVPCVDIGGLEFSEERVLGDWFPEG